MRIYVFLSHKGASIGFSTEEAGDRLPKDLGPWTAFKSFNLKDAGEHRIGVDIVEMLEAIHDDGYYVTQ